MKESLRDLMHFLNANGELIYYSTMAAIVLIMSLSVLSGYRNRNKSITGKLKKEKPLSSLEFFIAASSHGEEASDEDYFKYREEFEQRSTKDEVSEEEEDLSRFERLVETYCPKLILGCILSLVLMAVVAAPYLIIENFA